MTNPKETEHPDPDRPAGLDPERLMAMGQVPEPKNQGEVIYTSGKSFTPPTPAELAAAFPDLEILGLLGQGGMGAVYKAVQKRLEREVALKILPPEVGKDPSFSERFRREARTLARLSHPHVVAVHDFGEQGGFFYLLMEFVDGMNLRQMLEMGQLTPREALLIVPQICDALQYAHDLGIVHRDIKPENILIDQRGQVHIADFGLAKIVGRGPRDFTLTEAHHRLGTPHYMAPEQVEHPAQVDHRADIYSLGVVFYEMLTGQLPLGRFEPPSAKGRVSSTFDPVVMRSLEKEPSQRYQHASEVKTEVESLDPEAPPPPKVSATAKEPPRLSRLALVGFLWLLLSSLGGPVLVWSAMVREQVQAYERVNESRRQAELRAERAERGEEPPPDLVEPSPEAYAKGIESGLQVAWLLMFTMLLGVAVGPALGAFAIPRIRHSRGRLYGMGMAVFTAFLVPLLVANILVCIPLQFIDNNNVFGVVLTLLILVMAVLDIWFLIWFTRRMSTVP